MLGEHARRQSLREILKGVFDLERIAQKVRFRRATPRDLASLRRTLAMLDPLRAGRASPRSRRCWRRVGDFERPARRSASQRSSTSRPRRSPTAASIRPRGRRRARTSASRCARTRARDSPSSKQRERERTGIKTLRVKYASTFGYAIEVGKSYAGAVPADYVRKQTLTTGERYVTPELKELELAISTAQTRQERLEPQLFEGAGRARCGAGRERCRARPSAIAEIDVLAALAQCAAERGYVRPSFVRREQRRDRGGASSGNGGRCCTRTSCRTTCSSAIAEHRFILLTGPNMGGKSTYLRQAGLLAIMAQIGSFVPAKSMRLGIVDRIFTRIGAGDDLASGQSTFYMEMAEAATILRRSTARSLAAIDEVGRGTGTLDGLAIAQAICEFLLGLEEQAPMVLFATHFHELCALAEHWGSRRQLSHHGGRRTARVAARRSFRIACSRAVLRARSASRSRAWRAYPTRSIERAQEIADALSGEADIETRDSIRGSRCRSGSQPSGNLRYCRRRKQDGSRRGEGLNFRCLEVLTS